MTDTYVLVKWEDSINDANRPGDHPAYQRCISDLAAEVRLLRERLAAQEPDATLGRLVREGREPL